MDRKAAEQVLLDLVRELCGDSTDIIQWLKHPEAVREVLQADTSEACCIEEEWGQFIHFRDCTRVERWYKLKNKDLLDRASDRAFEAYIRECATANVEPTDSRLKNKEVFQVAREKHWSIAVDADESEYERAWLDDTTSVSGRKS
jgi:hypothetical protein